LSAALSNTLVEWHTFPQHGHDRIEENITEGDFESWFTEFDKLERRILFAR
jgi:hypothetical protein